MGCLTSHFKVAPKNKNFENCNAGPKSKNAPSALYGIPMGMIGTQSSENQMCLYQNYGQSLGKNGAASWVGRGNNEIYIPGHGHYQLIEKCHQSPNDDKKLFANDSRLPLNRRQIFSLNKSWKGISRNMDTTGVIMFVKLFSSTPKLLTLFRNIVIENEDNQWVSVKDSIELETHAEIVMNTMDEAITNFGDFDKFNQILTSIGGYHYGLQDFKVEYFWLIKVTKKGHISMSNPELAEEPFLEAVKETLGDRYSTNMENIYKVTIKFILTTLVKGYFMAKENKH